MHDSDSLLDEGLKYLAAAAPEEAPRRIAANLEVAFSRYHFRRKRIRAAQFTALAASLLLSTVLWVYWRNLPLGGRQDSMRVGPAPQAARDSIASSSPGPAISAPPTPRTPPPHQDRAAIPGGKFIFMPGVDPETPTGSLMVVRLELPTSALSLVGLLATGDSSQDRVTADILVDEDGTAYAIRVPNESQ